jgi:hypothetical protein
MSNRYPTRLFVVLPALLAGTVPCLAVDGVREISQAAIEEAGGFPYVITETGSYRLTSNLIVTSPSVNAIEVGSGLQDTIVATIDLNGFTISGPAAEGATGDGIATGFTNDATVLNGTIKGFRTGINGAARWRVENIRAVDNSRDGVFVARGSTVRNVTASGNGRHGISSAGGLVTGCVLDGNTGYGLNASSAFPVNYSNNLIISNGQLFVQNPDATFDGGGNVCANTSNVASPCE